ncbi:MAG: hypothetical protein U0105_01185 [Candidatus Obscuribacterales bacterium]
MRTRIGITAPLSLDDAGHARLPLPRLVENNFSVACKHNVFFQSPTACKATIEGLKLDHPAGKFYQLHGEVDSRKYEQSGAAVIAERSPDVVRGRFSVCTQRRRPLCVQRDAAAREDQETWACDVCGRLRAINAIQHG